MVLEFQNVSGSPKELEEIILPLETTLVSFSSGVFCQRTAVLSFLQCALSWWIIPLGLHQVETKQRNQMYLLSPRRNSSLIRLILTTFWFFLNSGRLVQFQHLSKMTDSIRTLQHSQGLAQINSVSCSNLLTPSNSLC